MLLKDTESNVQPYAVQVEEHEGRKTVRLADNIRQEQREDCSVYVYDEVVFELPADRTDTDEEIREDFDAWWAYGSQDEEAPMTLEERVEMIEEILMGGGL